MMVIEHISIECRKIYIREITSTNQMRRNITIYRANENEKWKKQNKKQERKRGKAWVTTRDFFLVLNLIG